MTKILYITTVITLIFLTVGTSSTMYYDDDTPCESAGYTENECISHDTAQKRCEELGLTYDYEAEGFLTSDYCY